jgi:pimeloyl-ACP methyl ester carboxylesterase
MPSWGACADEEIRVGEAGRPARFLHAGRGRPMVVLHADGENRRDWGWVLAGLASRYEADLAILPAAGHLPHVEQPEPFVASVLAFLGAGGRP